MSILRALSTHYNDGEGLADSCLSICGALFDQTLQVETWFPASRRETDLAFVRNAFPRFVMPYVFRLPEPNERLRKAVEKAFLRALRPGDIAYLWVGVSLETYQRVKDRGNIIVSQRSNCHRLYAKRLLDQEYARIGWPGTCGITEEDAIKEQKKMDHVDFVYSMSRFVTESLLASGVPRTKILPTSSGWDPGRMNGEDRLLEKDEGITVLFVGNLSVRKGIHLLLEAWKRASIKGRLVLAGEVPSDVAEQLAEPLARPDVICLGYRRPIGAVYRSADVFVCGSLEEGGPKVTYEAMGCGLPVIVSPMGAGPARNGMDGFVIDPHDIEGWADALKRLATDVELRQRMGTEARIRADEFTWKKVGSRRREMLLAAINARRSTVAASKDSAVIAPQMTAGGFS